MLRLRTLTLGALLLCSCGGGDDRPIREWTPDDHGQPEAGDPEGLGDRGIPPEEELTGDPVARAAAALWRVTCAPCHGIEGRGDGQGRPPGVEMADFTDPEWQAQAVDSDLSETIRVGRGEMEPYGDRIRPQGIAALVQHIRTLGPAGAEPPPAPDGAPAPGPGDEAPTGAPPAPSP